MKKKDFFLLACMACMGIGCSHFFTDSPTRPKEQNPSVSGLYRLRPMDPLKINLLGIPEEKQLETKIDEKGHITLPYMGEPIRAAGLTTSELERKIQSIYIYGKIYRSITVNVLTSSQSYYMEGEVGRPQEYPLTSRITLLQAIAAASGYTEFANQKKITITRDGQIMKFNGKELEKHPERDVPVEVGDRIKVHRALF